MRVDELDLGSLIPERFTAEGDGARFLALLLEEFPSLAPEKYGNFEPLRTHFTTIQACVSSWKSPFLWSRRKPSRVSGTVFMDERHVHSAISLQAQYSVQMGRDFERLIPRLASLSRPDFAYVHYLTVEETRQTSYEIWHNFQVGISTHQLRKGIPTLAWGTFLGRPYAELIGVDKLASAPAFRREQVAGGWFIQLTESLADVKSRYEVFHARRNEVEDYLGRELFIDRSGDLPLRVPKFSFD